MVIRMANNGRKKPFVRLWHIALWSVSYPKSYYEPDFGGKKKTLVYILSKVSSDALLPVLFSFLLGLFEDEFRYVAVEVIICNCARHRCTHLGTDKAGYYRRERTVSHPWVCFKDKRRQRQLARVHRSGPARLLNSAASLLLRTIINRFVLL
jgi:hypothetical protein